MTLLFTRTKQALKGTASASIMLLLFGCGVHAQAFMLEQTTGKEPAADSALPSDIPSELTGELPIELLGVQHPAGKANILIEAAPDASQPSAKGVLPDASQPVHFVSFVSFQTDDKDAEDLYRSYFIRSVREALATTGGKMDFFRVLCCGDEPDAVRLVGFGTLPSSALLRDYMAAQKRSAVQFSAKDEVDELRAARRELLDTVQALTQEYHRLSIERHAQLQAAYQLLKEAEDPDEAEKANAALQDVFARIETRRREYEEQRRNLSSEARALARKVGRLSRFSGGEQTGGVQEVVAVLREPVAPNMARANSLLRLAWLEDDAKGSFQEKTWQLNALSDQLKPRRLRFRIDDGGVSAALVSVRPQSEGIAIDANGKPVSIEEAIQKRAAAWAETPASQPSLHEREIAIANAADNIPSRVRVETLVPSGPAPIIVDADEQSFFSASDAQKQSAHNIVTVSEDAVSIQISVPNIIIDGEDIFENSDIEMTFNTAEIEASVREAFADAGLTGHDFEGDILRTVMQAVGGLGKTAQRSLDGLHSKLSAKMREIEKRIDRTERQLERVVERGGNEALEAQHIRTLEALRMELATIQQYDEVARQQVSNFTVEYKSHDGENIALELNDADLEGLGALGALGGLGQLGELAKLGELSQLGEWVAKREKDEAAKAVSEHKAEEGQAAGPKRAVPTVPAPPQSAQQPNNQQPAPSQAYAYAFSGPNGVSTAQPQAPTAPAREDEQFVVVIDEDSSGAGFVDFQIRFLQHARGQALSQLLEPAQRIELFAFDGARGFFRSDTFRKAETIRSELAERVQDFWLEPVVSISFDHPAVDQ